MNNCWIIVILACLFPFTNISLFAQPDQTWTITDIINVAKAHFSQFQDIEYSFDLQVTPIADPKYKKTQSVTLLCVPEKKWEKRYSTTIYSASPEKVYKKTKAWNGEQTKMVNAIIQDQETSEPLRHEGLRVSEERMFSLLEPMNLLYLNVGKNSNYSRLIDYLGGEDVLIEGYEKIGNYDTIVVMANLVNKPRANSLAVKFWLDMDRGALPLRVELYHKEKLVRTTSEVCLSEIKPGIFFPTACKVRTFGGKSKGRWSQGEVSIFQMKAGSIKINQGLQKEDFDIKFDYNMPVWDDNIKLSYHEGVGIYNEKITDMMLLEQLAEDAKQNYNKTASKTDKSKQNHKVELDKDIHRHEDKNLNSEQTMQEPGNNSVDKMAKPHKYNVVLIVLSVISILTVYFIARHKSLSKKTHS